MRSDGLRFVLAVCLVALGFGLAILTHAGTPSCPHEDSCYPDYYEGEWHIIPGQRTYEPMPTASTHGMEPVLVPIRVGLDNGGTLLTNRQQ